ncbi:LacI family DNA-binding transcriptional regulator [Tunturibacter empetritectus]|uniref:LacI family transcriptional regulator n=1 Tax=Tunturiibacter empetritectus TaxID=3069691 RepID=A0A7W8IGV6_9BACT|nr:LacI family DNA-binding transcriptional regulator [Edaphobacter lichenicola]MBB5316937.1 LacI family transcriptional regulator [Edaphobacter lichenicola]
MNSNSKTAGIKDIAQALGISIGTVDRALHERTGVSPKTKARVLQIAEQLGYKPNLAAQALKLNRRIEIAAVLPKQISHFFDPLRAGIRAAAEATVGLHVKVTFYEYQRLGQGDVELLEARLKDKYDGIIFTPGNPRKLDPVIRRLTAHGTAMLCVASDAPGSDRIGLVSAHAYTSGALAAELLAHKLYRKTNVATITGELTTLDHAEKLRGFAATLAMIAPHLSLLPAVESHERPKEAYRQTLTLLHGDSKPQGLYISTANSIPVLQALEEEGMLGKIQVVTTDLFQELVPLIETGKILATLYQRPFTQGKVAFESLITHLLEDKKTSPMIRLAPHIIFRSNLPLFTDRLDDLPDSG